MNDCDKRKGAHLRSTAPLLDRSAGAQAPSAASPPGEGPQHGDGLVTGLASRGRRHADDAEVGHPRTLSPSLILLLTHGGLAIAFCLIMYWVFARQWPGKQAVVPWLTQAGRNLSSVHDFVQSYGWLVLVAAALLLALDVWTYARIRKGYSSVAARVWSWGVAALLVVMLCAGPVMLHRHLNPQRPMPSSGALKP